MYCIIKTYVLYPFQNCSWISSGLTDELFEMACIANWKEGSVIIRNVPDRRYDFEIASE